MADIEFIKDRLVKEILNDSYPDELRSVLLYQAGQIIELTGGDTAEALRQYLLALKLDDPFPLPVLATCSILARARSFERLNKFVAMAEDRTTGRVQGLVRLLLAEHIDAAPVEDRDRHQLLELVAGSEHDRVLALSLLEWEKLCSGDAPGLMETLSQWLDATGDARMACQLRLELARLHLEAEDQEAALSLLGGAIEGNGGVFPVLGEVCRLGLQAGDPAKTVAALLQEAQSLLAEEQTDGDGLGARFVLASPSTPQQACAFLTLMAWQILSRDPDARRSDPLREKFERVLTTLDPEVALGCGLDGIMVDHLLGSGSTEALDAYLQATGEELAGLDAAWSRWNRARCSLARGDLEGVARNLARIRELGLDSTVLDALESLGGEQRTEEKAVSPDQDPVRAFMDLESSWNDSTDHQALARALAGWEQMDADVADVAYVAARLGGGSFLRTRALQAWSDAGGPLEVLALLEGIRTHGFEHLSEEQLRRTIDAHDATDPAVLTFAQLASTARLGEAHRDGKWQADLAAVAARMLGADTEDPRVQQMVDFVRGEHRAAVREQGEPGPLFIHSLLKEARAAGADPVLPSWIESSLGEGHDAPPDLTAVLAHLGLAHGEFGEELISRLAVLLDPDSGLDPGMRLLMALQVGGTQHVVDAMSELVQELEPGPLRASLQLLGGLGRLCQQGDVDGALDGVTAALEDDPSCIEALYAFVFLAPAAGRWEDFSIALDRLVEAGSQDDPHVVAWRRQRMLAALVVDRDLETAQQEAEAVLKARGGDPLALIVRMAAAGAAYDLEAYARELARLSLWFGDPSFKGQLVHHQLQLMSLMTEDSAASRDLPRPDVVNLSYWVANASLNGPVDLTDSGIDAALAEIRTLRSVPFRATATAQLAELVESAGQPHRALELFSAAFEDDPQDPAVVEGMMRLGKDLDEPTALARGSEARASMTSDKERAVQLLLVAAEAYASREDTTSEAARCFQRAAQIDPSDPRSFGGLVRAMELKGDFEGLIDLLERKVASTMDPAEIESLQLKLADLKRKTKDFEGAILALDDLLLVQPGKVTAWKMKMDLYLQMQDFGQALSTAERLLELTTQKAPRVTVLQKCVSISLTKLKDLDAGLKYCLMLVDEGDAEQDLVNKTMRLALRLEKWDDAAALQQSLAERAQTRAERINMLLKKAEILIRYARDASAAEEVYKAILEEEPVAWDALVRWNASRGTSGMDPEELEPYLDRVKTILDEDPTREDALVFLVKAYRMLRMPAAARHFDAIHKLLAGPDEEGPAAPARPSLTSMLPEIPSGSIDADERDEMLGVHGESSLAVGVLSNLCEGGALELLRDREAIAPLVETQPMESALPVARQLQAWAGSLGVKTLELLAADDLEDGVRLLDGTRLVLDTTVGHTAPQTVQFRMGLALGSMALRVPVATMMQADELVELIKAGLLAADRDPAPLMPGEGTVELADALRSSCTAGCLSRLTSLAEVAPASHGQAIEAGVRTMTSALVRSGLLVSGSFWGLLAFRHPSLADEQECEADEVREFLQKDIVLSDGLRFLLSSSYGKIRRDLGLEY